MMYKVIIPLILFFAIVIIRSSDLSLSILVNRVSLEIIPVWEQTVMIQDNVPVCDPEVSMTFDSIHYSKIEKVNIDKNTGAMVLQARIFWLSGMCNDALNVLGRAVNMNSYSAAVLMIKNGERTNFSVSMANNLSEYTYLRAIGAQNNKESIDTIIEWFEASYKLRPQFKTAERLGGIYLYEKESKEDTLRIWKILVVELPTNDPERWWAAGQVAELEGRWLDAATYYGQGMSLSDRPQRFIMRQQYASERANRE